MARRPQSPPVGIVVAIERVGWATSPVVSFTLDRMAEPDWTFLDFDARRLDVCGLRSVALSLGTVDHKAAKRVGAASWVVDYSDRNVVRNRLLFAAGWGTLGGETI